MLKVFCDGSITGSHWAKKGDKETLPHAWCGWWVKDEGDNHVHHHSLDLGENAIFSANVAEYMAVRSALSWLREHHPTEALRVHSDSQLVMQQLAGVFAVHDKKLAVLHQACSELAATFPSVRYQWIRREENLEADVLSKALQTWKRIPTWQEVLEEIEPPT